MDQAEQLRNIIKKQQLERKMARVITVTSGKGGVGKSSVSVNLGIQLSKQGKKVVIIDADFGLANIEVMLGIRPSFNMADLLYRGKELEEIITPGPYGLGFISGGSGIGELANVTKDEIYILTNKLHQLDEIADIVIIDTGAGITDAVLDFVVASSEVILVTTPEPTSITDSYALLKTLNKKEEFTSKDTIIKMIANRVDNVQEGMNLYQKLNIVIDKFLDFKIDYLGAIPHDSLVSKAIMQQKPYSMVYPNSNASKAVIEISNLICNNNDEKKVKGKGIAGLFSNFYHSKIKR